jgi:transposase
MQTITTIGLDIAKSVFQVHGVDAGGQIVNRRANLTPHRRPILPPLRGGPLLVALVSSELAGIAEARRARVA